MAKYAYIGGAGVAKKVSKIYIGVDDVARKVKKVYIGDANGKARLCFDATSGSLPQIDGIVYEPQTGWVSLCEDCDPCTVSYADSVTVSGTTVSLVSPVSSSASYYDPNEENADAVIQVTEDLLRGKFVQSNYGAIINNNDNTGSASSDGYPGFWIPDACDYGIIYIAEDATFETHSTEGGDYALVCTSGWYIVSAGSGGGSGPLPTFYYDGDMSSDYEFEEGMTFEQWVNSEYNLDGWYIQNSAVYDSNGFRVICSTAADPAVASDTIEAGETYSPVW